MDKTIIQQNLYMQKAFFTSGTTQNIKFRKESLKKLYTTITNKKDAIEEALNKDLGKSSMEGFMCEVGLPVTFNQLGIVPSDELLLKVADTACTKSVMSNMPFEVTPADVIRAMLKADLMGKSKLTAKENM